MTHRTLAGFIVALVAIVGHSPVLFTDRGLKPAAQRAATAVSLLSVSPGTPSGDADWCIGAERAMLTAHVVGLASMSEVTTGTIEWQVCEGRLDGFPKEDCGGHGFVQWRGAVISDLSSDSTPSIGSQPRVPVLGFRLRYRPAPGSGFLGATSEPFNLDTTCSP